MKKLTLALAAAGLFGATAANAALVVINVDDFTVPGAGQIVSDLTTGDGAVTNTNNALNPANVIGGTRTISSELLTSSAPVGNQVFAGAGILDITNGGGEDSEAIVSWTLPTNLIPGIIVNPKFYFKVLQSDGNLTNVQLLIGATSLGSFNIPGNTSNQDVEFGISPAALGLINAGGTLSLKINGEDGWDASFDQFGFSYDTTEQVPEPATMSLLGLGLAGLGFGKRRARKGA